MSEIPLDQGPARRRVGPFWIEEGLGPLAVCVTVILVVAALYVAGALQNHPG